MIFRNKTGLGEACVVSSAVLFGLMPLLVKIVVAHGGNAYMAALGRFFFGSLILFAFICGRQGSCPKIAREQLWEILPLSVYYALTPVLLFLSYDYMDSGLATTLHFTFPAMVIALSAILFRIFPDRRQMVCAILCIAGVSQLSGGGPAEMKGIVFAVLSGAAYALYIIYLGRSPLQSQSALTVVFWMSLLSSAEIAAAAAVTGNLVFIPDITAWLGMLALAFFATALALVLFQKGLFYCGAVRASLLCTFEPLTSLFIGCLVFQEILTAQNVIGILCVLGAGVLLVLPASLFTSVKRQWGQTGHYKN